jgi:hypothetical protein
MDTKGWLALGNVVGNLGSNLLGRKSQQDKASEDKKTNAENEARARQAWEAEEQMRIARTQMAQQLLGRLGNPHGLDMTMTPEMMAAASKPRPFAGQTQSDPTKGFAAGYGADLLKGLGDSAGTAALGMLAGDKKKPKPVGANGGATDVAGGSEGGASVPGAVGSLAAGGAPLAGAAPFAAGAAATGAGALAGNLNAGASGTNRAAGTAVGAISPGGAVANTAARELGGAIGGDLGRNVGNYAGLALNPAAIPVTMGQKLFHALKGLF